MYDRDPCIEVSRFLTPPKPRDGYRVIISLCLLLELSIGVQDLKAFALNPTYPFLYTTPVTLPAKCVLIPSYFQRRSIQSDGQNAPINVYPN